AWRKTCEAVRSPVDRYRPWFLLSTIPPEKSATFRVMRFLGASGYPRKVRNSLESCRSCSGCGAAAATFRALAFAGLKHDFIGKSLQLLGLLYARPSVV